MLGAALHVNCPHNTALAGRFYFVLFCFVIIFFVTFLRWDTIILVKAKLETPCFAFEVLALASLSTVLEKKIFWFIGYFVNWRS